MDYNPIKEKKIRTLEQNGCWADDWSKVFIVEGFDTTTVHNVHFSGKVMLGNLGKMLTLPDGTKKRSGIRNVLLHNVTVKNNCYISNVHNGLFNVDIESDVVIENVGKIICSGKTAFGNGHHVSVLSEAGGRELPITAKTNAQFAYFNVLYRHDTNLMTKLENIAEKYAESMKRTRCYIGDNACITNSSEIVDVFIGAHAIVNGVSKLTNGTIDSSAEAPTIVGNDVIAENFIFQKGSSVEDGAMISSGLIGEGTKIGKQFSAENSVLFANSEGLHSEITSVFGGPYTVTHHRSTLLIAGLFSFYNAGSGTNQSNHMYKLGPVHQGILERGCKTGSFSYLLWPSRVGAFSAIIGKHYSNFNTSNLPFSYINEENGKSVVVPAMNLFTTGTLRDGMKWPGRDRRTAIDKLDFIIFDVLSPYTIQRAIRGFEELTSLYETAEKSQEFVSYNGIRIKRLLLKTSRRYYRMAIDKYFGDMLIARFNEEKPSQLKNILKYDNRAAAGDQEWLDICGLLCAQSRAEELLDKIKTEKVDSFDTVYSELKNIYDCYQSDAWNWFLIQYKALNSVELIEETSENLKKFLTHWKDTSLKYYHMILQDSQKEFEGSTNLSYGIDGQREADFENVRGRFEDNKFVLSLNAEIDNINHKYAEILKSLS